MGMTAAERHALHRKRVKERMQELKEELARLRAIVGKKQAAPSSVTVPTSEAGYREIVAPRAGR